MNKICIVAFSNLANDGRLLRQIESMSEMGQVTTIGYGTKPPKSEIHHSIPNKYSYLPLTPMGIFALLFQCFDFAYQRTPAVKWCRNLVSQIDADVLILNDVQTIGLIKSSTTNRVTVMDMHEYAPEEISDDWRFRILLRRYYQYLCAKYLTSAELVTTVSSTIAKKFNETLGIFPQVIMNSSKFYDLTFTKSKYEKIRLVHAGLASKGRRIETMIEAMRDLPQFEMDLYLVPAPRQKHYFSKLSRKIAKSPNVKLLDPVQHSQLVATLNSYDVGLLIINPSNFSLAHCLPNKLFEYIQARIMVITGPTPDIRDIVDEQKLGIVLDGFSQEDLKNCLLSINRKTIEMFKRNSETAATQLNFENESIKFKRLIQELISLTK
jgi:glycosyltransferase involved in cell wall biosynthesis